jgi:hypothetical protein
MIWKALVEDVRVLDATSFVTLVHQNRGYSVASGRITGNANDPLSMVNPKTIGGLTRIRDMSAERASHERAYERGAAYHCTPG